MPSLKLMVLFCLQKICTVFILLYINYSSFVFSTYMAASAALCVNAVLSIKRSYEYIKNKHSYNNMHKIKLLNLLKVYSS